MRRQDELISIYPGQGRIARKYLLSQMEGLSRAFDSEELLEFLQLQLGDPDAGIRGQALYSLALFLRGYIQKRYSLSEQFLGVWSTYGKDQVDTKARVQRILEWASQATAVTQAALWVAQPLAHGLLSAISRVDGWSRTRAILALGHFGVKDSQNWLSRAWEDHSPSLEVGLALGEARAEQAEAEVLPSLRRAAAHNPDLYLVLSTCPGAAAFSVLMDAIPKTTLEGRMNLAQVLAHLPENNVMEAFRRLCKQGEGWVIASGLAALETLGQINLLPVIQKVYQSAHHPFLKVQAVKAAGGIRGSASIAFCIDVLNHSSDEIRAVALESLARLHAPPEQLRQVAISLLNSDHLKARVNAILASLSAEEVLDAPALGGLLMSTDPLQRLEAAYCLGYLQSRRTLELLGTLASLDPSVSVRQQAIKSLSKYPAEEALPHLRAVLSADDPRMVLTAARVLCRYEGPEGALVCDAIIEMLSEAKRSYVRAMLFRALGVAAARSQHTRAPDILLEGFGEKEPKVLAGVVEGWKLLGVAGDSAAASRLEELSRTKDARIRARALMVRWNSGDTDAVAELGRMADSADVRTAEPALESALEIGLLLNEVVTADRFPELSGRLVKLLDTPGYRDFVAREGHSYSATSRIRLTHLGEPEFAVKKEIPGADVEALAPPPEPRPAPRPVPVETDPGERSAAAESGGRPTPALARIQPSARNNARAAASPPRPAPKAGVGVAQLKNFLQKPAVAKGGGAGVGEQIKKQTYLVSNTLSPSRLAELWASPVGKAIAAAPVLVLLLVWMFSGGPQDLPPPPPPKGFPGHLWVALVQGTCKKGNGAAIQSLDIVRPGDLLQTGQKSEIILMTPPGNRVLVHESSVVAYEGAFQGKDGVLYRFKDATGDILFEFQREPELELILGTTRVHTTGAWIEVGRDQGQRSLTVHRGEAMVQSRTGNRVLKEREKLPIQG